LNQDDIPYGFDSIAQLRVPPHSFEAECAVLGALLLNNAAWDRVGDLLVDSDFYNSNHRLIFAAIGSMINASREADVITVFEQLERAGNAEEVGGLAYLNSLAQYVPSSAAIRRYAEVVRERAVLRKLATAGDEISASAFDVGERTVAEIQDEAERKVLGIGEETGRMKDGFKSLDILVVGMLDDIQERADNPDAFDGLSSGLHDLDRMTSGFQDGDLIVLAARPSMGKTALAINIAEHAALNEGRHVAVFSMEMGAPQLTIRMVGSIGRIDQTNLRTGRLTDDEWPRLTEAVEKLRTVSMNIDDTPAMTVTEIRSAARRLARQVGKLGLIVIDYIQLMGSSGTRSSDNRATEVGEMTRGLKSLAKELGCPVIALSQLSRKVEERGDKRPLMSDLRESGAIEQDADVIMFIYRDDYYNADSKEPGVAEIILSKQRSGPTGTVKVGFQKQLTKFEDLSRL
jgi:replicative DNA helicase